MTSAYPAHEPRADSARLADPDLAPVEDAIATLQHVQIAPFTRPRVLAAARARGTHIELTEWYVAAWQLEREGRYARRGERDTEWLEPIDPATEAPHPVAGAPSARVLAALATELERIHDLTGLLALGQAAADSGAPTVAERCARAAVELDPQHLGAALTLTRLLALRGDFEAAETECRRALRFAPDDVEAHVLLANCLDDRQRHAQAEALYRRALGLAPDNVAVHYNYGVLLMRLGHRAEAEQHVRQAIAAAPEDAAMLGMLAALVA